MRWKYCPARNKALVCLAMCGAMLPAARGEFLFTSFLVPSFANAPATEYTAWDVFYAPYNQPNYPDYSAPNGDYQTRSAAGFPANATYSPSNPSAYWDTNNATITQTGTSSAFIIGPGSAGN